MAELAYQVTDFAYQGAGEFAYQGSVDEEPAAVAPPAVSTAQGGAWGGFKARQRRRDQDAAVRKLSARDILRFFTWPKR